MHLPARDRQAWAATRQTCYTLDIVALRKRTPARMTLDEFLAWNSGDPQRPDLATHRRRTGCNVAGKRRRMGHPERDGAATGQPPVRPAKSLPGGDRTRASCRRVRANRNYRVPDLGVTCAPPSHDPMVPEPIVLIEILSPSNEADTRANIWAYTTVPSVREILAIRSTRIEAELLVRDAGRHVARRTGDH